MWTLAVLNQKGGVGKSTLATNLASAAHLAGKRTLLMDLDRQGSAVDWSAARKDGSKLTGLTTVKVEKPLAGPRWGEMTQGYEVVILDGAPRLGEITQSAAAAADTVLIPVQPGPFDLWAAPETLALLDEADGIRAELGRKPTVRIFVVNRANSRTVLAHQMPGALAPSGKVADVMIGQRIAYAEAAAVGESVLTTHSKGDAAREIRRLYKALAANGGT